MTAIWKTVLAASIPAFLGSGLGVAGIEYFSKDRELDIRMVEIGLGILKADPSENEQISPAREWAIRLVETHSGQKFSENDQKLLLSKPIDIAYGWASSDVAKFMTEPGMWSMVGASPVPMTEKELEIFLAENPKFREMIGEWVESGKQQEESK